MNSKTALLFVYGSLRKGVSHPKAAMLAEVAQYVGVGRLQGRLYNVGHYPGATLSNDPLDTVIGDIYRLCDAGAMMPVFDDYEECSVAYPQPHEYNREMVSITLVNGQPVQAWAYIYNRSVGTLPRIESGDYLAFLRASSDAPNSGLIAGRPF